MFAVLVLLTIVPSLEDRNFVFVIIVDAESFAMQPISLSSYLWKFSSFIEMNKNRKKKIR